MNTDRHGVARCTGRMLVGWLCIVGFGACDFRPSAPETRATYFIQKFIVEPQAVEDLRSVALLAEGQSPEILVEDMPTRAAVTYLRARRQLGTDFGFHAAGTTPMANGNKLVNVVVSEVAATAGQGSAVRFQVELRKQAQAWLVARIQSD